MRVGDKIADEDTIFVQKVLSLKGELDELSPVVVTKDYLREYLQKGPQGGERLDAQGERSLLRRASVDQDILLLMEGGASLREGLCGWLAHGSGGGSIKQPRADHR
jgi:hypothetical protein